MLLDDYDNYDDEDLYSYKVSSSAYASDIKRDVFGYMDHFFCDKSYWAGGPIPKSKIYKEEYVEIVMNFNLMDALAVALYCLKKSPIEPLCKQKNWDTDLYLQFAKQCGVRFIPKCHIGGMFLVYLALCHDIKFLPVVNKMAEIREMIVQDEKQEQLNYEERLRKRRDGS